MFRGIRMKLVLVYLLLILFSLQFIGAYFVRSLTSSLIDNDTNTALNQTQLIATIVSPQIAQLQSTHVSQQSPSLLSLFPQYFNGNVYVLNQDGVVEDTSAGSALIGQKRIDSVATQALVGQKKAVAIQLDQTSNEHILQVAVPMLAGGKFIGVVESVVPIQTTYTTVRQVTTIFYTGSALVLGLTALLGIVLSRAISRPILDVTMQARNMAAGDFSRRVKVQSDDELGQLGTAVNDLTGKLEEALAANLRERERLGAIIKYMGEGVVAFDPDLHIIFMNDVARALLPQVGEGGLTLATSLGLPIDEAGIKVDDGAFLKPLGDRLLHIHVTRIQDHQVAAGYVAIIRDVTEQETLNRARRDFVVNVSHELRTPLTVLKSYIEALQYGDDDTKTRREFLDVIEKETDRMVRLTEDLLQLSGLETKTGNDYALTQIEVSLWLPTVVERFQLQASAQNLQLMLDRTANVVIQGDPDMLNRLVDNLISNSLKYTAAGGCIHVAADEEQDYVIISVADTGIGIPEEDLPHIFGRFYRVDKARSRRKGGTGLGLALAREIAERHGGKILVESQLNVGTTIKVLLPIVEGGDDLA